MGLEHEIRQGRPFKNEHFKAVVNLIYTYNWTTDRLKQIFKRQQLTMQQYNILRILRGNKVPLSILELRNRMLDKMSDTSRLIDRLESKSLVKRKESKHDGRLVEIVITRKGLDLLQKIDRENDEITGLVSGITQKEARTLNRLLDKIRNR